MKSICLALFCGIIFSLGLSLSQMINPNKVLSFMDITGNWDPSLAFVMLGALTVTIASFRFILKRNTPLWEEDFHVPTRNIINKPLLLGAVIFGIGWGISGYCPGPAFAAMGLLNEDAIIMVASIYLGFFSHKWLSKRG